MCSGKYRTARIILDSYQAICFLPAAKAGQAEQGWMVFAALTHRNKLVLPKAPHAFGVTGFLLGCLGKRACHAPTKKALNTSCWGLCALCWTEFEGYMV
jgi:hypothetical protein